MARKSSLTIAQEKRQQAEHELATVQALAEARVMQQSLSLLESPQPVVTPWQEYPQYDDFNRWPAVIAGGYPWATLDDRRDGRYRPLYEHDSDLRMIRATARRLATMFPVVQGAITSLTNYVIAGGFEYEFQPATTEAKPYVRIVQSLLDAFLDRNDFIGHLDRDIHHRSREDGETLIGLYWDGKQRDEIRIELVDPNYIVQPANTKPLERMLGCQHKLSSWWHGVHTTYDHELKRDDVSRPLGYHVVFDPEGDTWDYLPSCRCEFIKRNVGSDARRGVSDLYAVQRDLELEAKIRRNTAEGAAILAAIVMIRQHAEGVTKSSVESFAQANRTTSYEKRIDSGTRTTNVEQLQPGTIKDTPYGMTTTVGPMGTLNQPIYIQVAQYLLRIIGTRWNMPEYLVSGDASNANYSSTLMSGLPFVRAREADQEYYAKHFESLIWKALRMYYEAGRIRGVNWQVLRQGLTLKVDYASPATRDKAEQAATNKALIDAGVMSKRTAASDLGLDYDEEQQGIAAEPKPVTPPQLLPFTGMASQQPAVESTDYSLAVRAMQRLMEGAE
jgi:hypothetical protein